MNNARIALVTGCLNLGGSTTFLCNLAGELVRQSVPVHVFSLEKHNPLAEDFRRLRVPLTITDCGPRIYEERIQACLEAVRNFEPTLVAGCLGPASFEVLRYVPSGIHRVGMVQSDDPGVYSTLAWYAPFLEAVVGVSQTITRRLGEMDAFSRKKTVYIPYGVPMPEQISQRPSQKGWRILYLGRLCQEQTRVQRFPEIFRALCQSGIEFTWTVAGDGPERRSLETSMKGGGLDQKVEFLGQVDYHAIPQLLENQEAMLLTSDYEGLPLSLLEAMGQGIVPVVTDLESGLREVVDARNGFLVPEDDTLGYARALIRLHRDREELAQKSLAARNAVYPTYSMAEMARRWKELAQAQENRPAAWAAPDRIEAPIGSENRWHFSPVGKHIRKLKRLVLGS